jgi:hypothetical protein
MHKGWACNTQFENHPVFDNVKYEIKKHVYIHERDELEAKNHIPNHWAFCPGEMESKPKMK